MHPFLTRALPEVAIVSSSRFVTADQDVANFVFGKNDLSALSAVPPQVVPYETHEKK